MRRRDFIARIAVGGTLLGAARAGRVVAQSAPGAAQGTPGPAQGTTSNLFDMDQMAAKSVRLPAKPGASPSMSDDDRDGLEHQIRCQCSCTLDVYTCRTTDFSCQVSPAMHRDIMSLVQGGYPAQEILDAFVTTYGERALMAPKREGFNLAGYLVPFAALGGGAVLLVTFLKRAQRRPSQVPGSIPRAPVGVNASSAEMEKLNAAIRGDDR